MSVPSTINVMSLKKFTLADNLPLIIEKVQFNFDQILLYGGGPKGDQGDPGEKGLPGATGIGQTGPDGRRGSYIYFYNSAVTAGSVATDPLLLEYDIVIDNDGDYFQIEKNTTTNDLEYIFKFNINTASLNSYWIDQQTYVDSSANTVDEWVRLDDGGLEHNLLVGRRTDKGGGFDKAEFYRLLVGLDVYPFGLPEVPITICNILPNSTDAANDNPFYQLAFKYRENATTNPGANSVFVKYTEQTSVNRYLFSIENSSVGAWWKHDTVNTDDSAFIIRGNNVRFIGKSVSPDVITEYLDFEISPNLAHIYPQGDLVIKSQDLTGSRSMELYFNSIFLNRNTTATGNIFVKTQDDCTFVVEIGDLVDDKFELYVTQLTMFMDTLKLDALSGSTFTIELADNTVVTGASSKQIDFNIQSYFNNIFGLAYNNTTTAVVDSGSGTDLDVTSLTTPVIKIGVSGSGRNWVDTITGGKDKQLLTLRVANTMYLRYNNVANGIVSLHGDNEEIYLRGDDTVTLQYNGTLGRWVVISSNISNYGKVKAINPTAISNNFDNLINPGKWILSSNAVMTNGSSAIGADSTRVITIVTKYDANTIEQEQYHNTDELDFLVYRRRRYVSTVSGTPVWSAWRQVLLSHNNFSFAQAYSFEWVGTQYNFRRSLASSPSAIGGGISITLGNGNHFVCADNARNLIHGVSKDFPDGTIICINIGSNTTANKNGVRRLYHNNLGSLSSATFAPIVTQDSMDMYIRPYTILTLQRIDDGVNDYWELIDMSKPEAFVAPSTYGTNIVDATTVVGSIIPSAILKENSKIQLSIRLKRSGIGTFTISAGTTLLELPDYITTMPTQIVEAIWDQASTTYVQKACKVHFSGGVAKIDLLEDIVNIDGLNDVIRLDMTVNLHVTTDIAEEI